MVYNVLDKKTRSRATSKTRANVNEVLAQELQKSVNSTRVKSLY